MTAKTPYWYCGHCGFANHPRGIGWDREGRQVSRDPELCEQCGAPRDHEDAVDYKPKGAE